MKKRGETEERGACSLSLGARHEVREESPCSVLKQSTLDQQKLCLTSSAEPSAQLLFPFHTLDFRILSSFAENALY